MSTNQSDSVNLGVENERADVGTAEPASPNQIPRHEQGQTVCFFYLSADHEQDWQPNTDDGDDHAVV